MVLLLLNQVDFADILSSIVVTGRFADCPSFRVLCILFYAGSARCINILGSPVASDRLSAAFLSDSRIYRLVMGG